MKKTMRVLAMTGMGVLASFAMSAGPAQAAGTAADSSAKAGTSKSAQVQQHRGGDRIVGYYSSPRACEFAGRIGQRLHRWSDYDCDFVRFGFRRGAWALEVEQGWGWGWNRPGNFGPGIHHNGPFGPNRGPFGSNRGPVGPFGQR